MLLKILIVDDDLAMRTLLKEILEEFEDKGVELLTTEKEVGTIESIKIEKPELVNLGVLMPGMSGFDVSNTQKNEHGMKDTYIMMLTADGQEYNKQNAKDVCVDIL